MNIQFSFDLHKFFNMKFSKMFVITENVALKSRLKHFKMRAMFSLIRYSEAFMR